MLLVLQHQKQVWRRALDAGSISGCSFQTSHASSAGSQHSPIFPPPVPAGAALCACSSLPPQDAHSYSKLNEGLGLGQQTHSQSSSPGPCWLRHGAVHKHQLPVSVRCLHNSFPSRSSADASSHGATLDQPDQPAASTSQPAQALGRYREATNAPCAPQTLGSLAMHNCETNWVQHNTAMSPGPA